MSLIGDLLEEEVVATAADRPIVVVGQREDAEDSLTVSVDLACGNDVARIRDSWFRPDRPESKPLPTVDGLREIAFAFQSRGHRESLYQLAGIALAAILIVEEEKNLVPIGVELSWNRNRPADAASADHISVARLC